MLKKFWSRYGIHSLRLKYVRKPASASLQREVKTEKYKFRGGEPKVCRIEEVIEEAEFHAIFDDKGLQTQPTPSNKPTSTVTIKEFVSVHSDTFFQKLTRGVSRPEMKLKISSESISRS